MRRAAALLALLLAGCSARRGGPLTAALALTRLGPATPALVRAES